MRATGTAPGVDDRSGRGVRGRLVPLLGLLGATAVLITAALAGTDGVGAAAVTIPNTCASPADQVVQYGLTTVSEPTAEQLVDNPIAFDLAGSVEAPARARAGSTYDVRATIDVDLQAMADRQLLERVHPQVVASGFPQLTGTSFLNLAIDDLTARFPLPEHTAIVGTPSVTSTGPSAQASVEGGALLVRLGPLRAGAYSVGGVLDGTTSTTHATSGTFTVTVDATVAVAATAPDGSSLVLRPGGLSYRLDSHTGVYFFGKLVSGGAAGPQLCVPDDPNQVLAATVVEGGSTTTAGPTTAPPTTTGMPPGSTPPTTAHGHDGHDHGTTTVAPAPAAGAPTSVPTTRGPGATAPAGSVDDGHGDHDHTPSPTVAVARRAAVSGGTGSGSASIDAVAVTGEVGGPATEVVVDPAVAAPGSEVAVRASGWAPAGNVVAVLHSEPILLGIRPADAAGALDATFVLPDDVSAGQHHVELTGAAADGTARTATADLVVAGPGPAVLTAGDGGHSHGHSSTPADGADSALFLGAVVLVLAAGATVAAATRVHRPVAPAAGTPATSVAAWLVAACSAGAGLLHLLAAPDHLDLDAAHGGFFLVVGWAQVALAAALVARRANRPVLVLGSLANLAVLGVWLTSRTIGVAGEIEPVGTADSLAVVLGSATVVGCILLLSGLLDGVGVGAGAAGAWAGAATTAVVLLVTASLLPGVATEHDHGTGQLASADGHEHGTGTDDHGHGDTATLAGADAHAEDGHAHAAGGSTSAGVAHVDDGHDHGTSGSGSGSGSGTGTGSGVAGQTTATTVHDDGHDHGAATTTTVHDDAHDHGTTTPPTPTTAAPTTPTTTHDHGPSTTPAPPVEAWRVGATDTEVALTWQLIAETQSAVATYTSIRDAESKGFVRIADDHMVNVDRMLDDRILDPDRIESLVIARVGGRDAIVGGMYLLNIGHDEGDIPALGGPLLTWHRHGGFCFDDALAIVGVGPCPPDTMFIDDPPMIHVWSSPIRWSDGTLRTIGACGTFAYLDVPHEGGVPGCTDPSGHNHDH